MGRKSQLKKLGQELKIRAEHSIGNPVKMAWEKGKLAGEGLRLFRMLKPIEAHITEDKCEKCTAHFQKIKNCPFILDLPDGSHNEATRHILSNTDKCFGLLQLIIHCPEYAKKHGRPGKDA